MGPAKFEIVSYSRNIKNLSKLSQVKLTTHSSYSEIEDCTEEWTYPSDSFDYVHIRWLNGSIDDWGMVFKEAYRICKPGGFIESFEGAPYLESDDGTVKDTDAVGQWGKIFVEYGRRSGRSFTTVSSGIQKKAIEEAGFVAIEEKDIKVSRE